MIDQFIDKRTYEDVTGPGQFLDVAQIDAFNRQGYLVLQGVLGGEEVARLREAADRLFEHVNGGEWVSAPEKQDRTFLAHVRGPLVQGIITDLNGPSEVLLGFLYRKQSTSQVPKLWHQDAVYWDMSDARVMALFTPVTPITRENGAIEVIPGSHRLGRLFHRPAPNYNLVCDISAFRDSVLVELALGDVMILHSHTVHRSWVNTTTQPRINFGLHFHNRETRIVRDAPTAAIYGPG